MPETKSDEEGNTVPEEQTGEYYVHCMSDCDWSYRGLHFENIYIAPNDYECKGKCD